MAKSTIPITEGLDYQARWFWIQACRLFAPGTKVVRVDYEANSPKGFDDVLVHYDPPIRDELGDVIHMDCYQLKFHVCQNGAFTYEALMDPAFIGATSISSLQRLYQAQKAYAADGKGCTFHIVTPWPVHPDDPLSEICGNLRDEVRLDKLFGESSSAKKIRKAWCGHLGVDENELKVVIRPLRIRSDAGGLKHFNDVLCPNLRCAGLRPVEDGDYSRYDDLIRKLQQDGHTEFDRNKLQSICEEQGLWVGLQTDRPAATTLGIRSFMRWAKYIEDETSSHLCLVRYFDGRRISDPALWNEEVLPRLADFLEANISRGESYHLHLEAHSSISFAAGYCLDPKCGADVTPVQSTPAGSFPWTVGEIDTSASNSLCTATDIVRNGDGRDVAVAMSVTHPIMTDVAAYIDEHLPSVGRVISCTVEPRPGPLSIKDGTHAFALAISVADLVKQRSAEERKGTLHIFSAAPNGLLFFLGRLARGFGRCVLYEYEFEGNGLGAYSPSIAFALQHQQGQ